MITYSIFEYVWFKTDSIVREIVSALLNVAVVIPTFTELTFTIAPSEF